MFRVIQNAFRFLNAFQPRGTAPLKVCLPTQEAKELGQSCPRQGVLGNDDLAEWRKPVGLSVVAPESQRVPVYAPPYTSVKISGSTKDRV